MEQRLSLVTLGVADIARSRRFYESLGWTASGASVEGTTFFQLGGIVLALWARASLAEDAGIADSGSRFGGIALAHNVRGRGDVDALLDEAERAGGRILKPAADAVWGGYTGYFADPDGHLWEVAWNPHFAMETDGSIRLPG
jgi:hypothetical protein